MSQFEILPFGVVVKTEQAHPSGFKVGLDAHGKLVAEVPDEHKGNVARSMLYFAHQYGHTLSADELALYKAWHAADPVDDREAERTLAILAEQDRANPFVACPELVDAL